MSFLTESISTLMVFALIVCTVIGLFVLQRSFALRNGAQRQHNEVELSLSDDRAIPIGLDLVLGNAVKDAGILWGTSLVIAIGITLAILSGIVILLVTDVPLWAMTTGLGVMLLELIALFVGSTIRRQQTTNWLPELILNCSRRLRSGESLDETLRSCAIRPELRLSRDLLRSSKQLQMGLAPETVFEELAQSHRYLDVRMFLRALSAHRASGGNLATVLERLASVAQSRRDLRRQIKVASSSAKLAALIVGCAGPLVLVYYSIEKKYFEEFLNDRNAWNYLLFAAALEVVGFAWLLLLSREDV